jgi:hypothetical protein
MVYGHFFGLGKKRLSYALVFAAFRYKTQLKIFGIMLTTKFKIMGSNKNDLFDGLNEAWSCYNIERILVVIKFFFLINMYWKLKFFLSRSYLPWFFILCLIFPRNIFFKTKMVRWLVLFSAKLFATISAVFRSYCETVLAD